MQKIRLQILVDYETLQSLHKLMEQNHYRNISQAVESIFRGYDGLVKRYNASCVRNDELFKEVIDLKEQYDVQEFTDLQKEIIGKAKEEGMKLIEKENLK